MDQDISISQPPDLLRLLSHDVRWQIIKLLACSDLRVAELVQGVDLPQNLVSYHLQKLRAHRLIREHRSIADGREVYYSLDVDRLKQIYSASGEALHPALVSNPPVDPSGIEGPVASQPTGEEKPGAGETVRVLFLCTHNSARSQMAEGILRTRSDGRIMVFSAGNEPSHVNPLAVRALQELRIDISDHQSKSLDQFLGQHFDYIITVCDRAREACPVFPGDPVRIHWSFPDPSAVEGSEADRYRAFHDTAIQLNTRIGYLLLMIQREFGSS
jgi:ArsR family transcriptional regulator, arsenate/arsenite/antimonite-responsive transcriptional repressor / arsenate reductase (thioredoxin)